MALVNPPDHIIICMRERARFMTTNHENITRALIEAWCEGHLFHQNEIAEHGAKKEGR